MEPLDTRQRGDFAEAAVLHAMIEAGLLGLKPFGRFGPYDMLIDMPDGRLVRVTGEVRTCPRRLRALQVVQHRSRPGPGRLRRPGDVCAVHAPTADGVYVLDVAAATTRVTSLRLEPTRSTQHLRVRFATDHTLKQWLGGSASEPLTPSAVRGGGVAAPA